MRVVARAEGLVRTFGSGRAALRVLDGVDLEVMAGELVAVVGRSGSGKSTLLHLLGGLDRPDGGTIELDGTRVERLGEGELARLRREKIGFVFQAFHLLPELSGLENVLLPARIGRDREALRRGRKLVEQLGFDGAGAHDGDGELACQLVACADQIFRDTDSIPDPDEYVELERATATLQERLGGHFDALWDKGRALDKERARELAESVAT